MWLMWLPCVRGAPILCCQHTDGSKSKINIRRYFCRGGILPELMEKECGCLLHLCSLCPSLWLCPVLPAGMERSEKPQKFLLLSLPLDSCILSEPGGCLRLTFPPLGCFCGFFRTYPLSNPHCHPICHPNHWDPFVCSCLDADDILSLLWLFIYSFFIPRNLESSPAFVKHPGDPTRQDLMWLHTNTPVSGPVSASSGETCRHLLCGWALGAAPPNFQHRCFSLNLCSHFGSASCPGEFSVHRDFCNAGVTCPALWVVPLNFASPGLKWE